MATFPPPASARVMRVEEFEENWVDVIVDTKHSHPMRVHCERLGETWFVSSEKNE